MAKAFIANDDIPAWSVSSTFYDGNTKYELKYGEYEKVSMMQAMLGQRGPMLEAGSGSCLVIAVYLPQHRAGMLIHLWREEDLSGEGADLIRKPFEKFPQLIEHLLSTCSQVSVLLDTKIGQLTVIDEFGVDQSIDYYS